MTETKKQTIREILQSIAADHGGQLTPEMVVEEARAKTHPLHKHFQWNNQKAAAEYRLQQAGLLIRTVRVTYEPSENREIKVRAFVNVRETPEDSLRERGSYVSFEDAMNKPEYREQVLAAAKRDANTFRAKYSALQEAQGIIGAINEAFKS